jgi:hypothetical protein
MAAGFEKWIRNERKKREEGRINERGNLVVKGTHTSIAIFNNICCRVNCLTRAAAPTQLCTCSNGHSLAQRRCGQGRVGQSIRSTVIC